MKVISLVEISSKVLPPELFVSLLIMLLICIFSIIVGIKAKKVNPLEKPKGIMVIAEFYVEYIDNLVATNMGPQYKKICGAIFGFICPYLFLSMISGLFGLPGPVTYLYVPLTLGIISFILIHATAAYYNKASYFKRYIDPFPIMLPINLLSMWAPLLSLTFRLFGNAIAGYVLMKLIYVAFSNIVPLGTVGGEIVGVGSFVAPLVTPVLHAYFDVFSGFIQTTVFTLLSMALIKNEVPIEISEKLDREYQEEVAAKERIDAQIKAIK